MAQPLTFAEYRPDRDHLEGIYAIGVMDHNPGVIQDMADAFDHQLAETPDESNLGELIAKVGPEKELQKNIAFVKEVLESRRDGINTARSWVELSGFLAPVERSYVTAESAEARDRRIDLAIITGGVRNWMERRAGRLVALNAKFGIDQVLLVAGNRKMGTAEGPDVEEGMTEADYMWRVILGQIRAFDIPTDFVKVDSGEGVKVMDAAVVNSRRMLRTFGSTALIAVVSNAGAWVQNAGQYRQAAKKVVENFDQNGEQLIAVSDGFSLGVTGEEPTATHQNPYSAIGQIVRNAQELVRHAKEFEQRAV